jgi:hypothetical protein
MFTDKLSKSIAEAVKKVVDEELKGQQHKIDVNKNNKIDAEDFKHLRAGKKPVAEAMQKADVPAYLRKEKGEKPLTVADVKGPRKDSISSKEGLAKLRNEEQEQIQEYQSVGGKYVHIAKPAKDAEAGTTDWDKEEKMAKDLTSKTTTKKPRKLGARQNFVRSTRVNEGFSAMLDAYEENGIKGLFESFKKEELVEEPTNDEFKKELDKQQAKSEGKAPQAEVAKAAVQAVKQEEVEQVEERSLTEPETKKKEEVVMSMKKGLQGFKDRYGDDAKSVMYATATKIAKKD